MKKRYWLIFLILAALLASCGNSDDSNDEESAEVLRVNIGAADNLMVGQGAALGSPSAAEKFGLFSVGATLDINSGLSTVESGGDVRGISIVHGTGKAKKPKKTHKIKRRGQGASKVRAALGFCADNWSDCEPYLVDKSDRAHKLKRRPKAKSHRLKNAAMFYERGGKIYYPDQSGYLVELDVSEDAPENDVYQTIRSGVVQAVMDKGGNWMLELINGQVVHERASDGAETRMNGLPLTGEPTVDVNNRGEAETNRFFFDHSRASGDGGFMFWHGAGAFYRSWLDNGQVKQLYGQYQAYLAYKAGGPSVVSQFESYPDTCEKLDISSDEYMSCAGTYLYVYKLGDASNDFEKLDLTWAGHSFGVSRKVTANSRYLFFYTEGGGVTAGISRFTRIDESGHACFHLFSNSGVTSCGGTAYTNTQYVMITDPTATDDNIVRFCGRKIGESQLYLVQISAADTSSPVFKETPVTSCEQLENLD